MKRKKLITASLIAGAMLFTACGGGGGGGGGGEVSMSGLVVDGYISGSKVCIEGTNFCTTTDANGKYSFKIKASELPNPVKIVASGGTDTATKKKLKGKIKTVIAKPSSNKAGVNLSPLTTLVAHKVAKGGTIAAAQKSIAKVLGITDTSKLDDDPMQDKTVFASAQRVVQMQDLAEATISKNSTGMTDDEIEALILDSFVDADTVEEFQIEELLDVIDNDSRVDEIPDEQMKFAEETMDKVEELLKNVIAQDSIVISELDELESSLDASIDDAEDKIEGAEEGVVIGGVVIGSDPDELVEEGAKENPMTTVDNLFAKTESSSVADAKKIFTNIRRVADKLYKENNNAESGLVITQKDAITAKIEPAMDSVETDVDATTTAVKNMVDAFSDSLDNDTEYQTVKTEIDDRFEKIGDLLDVDKVSLAETTTSYGDKVSVQYTSLGDNKHKYEVSIQNSSNGTDVRYSYVEKYDSNEDDTQGQNVTMQSGILKGSKYELKITSASMDKDASDFMIVNFIADTKIDTTNVDYTGLVTVSFKFKDEDTDIVNVDLINNLPKAQLNFDGTLKAGTRTFVGKIAGDFKDSSKNILSGKLTGSSSEPVVEGRFSIHAKHTDLDKVTREKFINDHDSWRAVIKVGNNFEVITSKVADVTKQSDGNFKKVITYTTTGDHTVTKTLIIDKRTLSTIGKPVVADGKFFKLSDYNFIAKFDDGRKYSLNDIYYEYDGFTMYGDKKCTNSDDFGCGWGEIHYDKNNKTFSPSDFVLEQYGDKIVRAEDIPSSLFFTGSVKDGKKSAILDIVYNNNESNNKLTTIKSLDLTTETAKISLKNAQLSSKNVNENFYVADKVSSLSFDKLSAEVTGSDNKKLTLDFKGSVSLNNHDVNENAREQYGNNSNPYNNNCFQFLKAKNDADNSYISSCYASYDSNKYDQERIHTEIDKVKSTNIDLSGEYSYDGTSFKGNIKADGKDLISKDSSNGTLELNGEFSSNASGFENFSINLFAQGDERIAADGDNAKAGSGKFLFTNSADDYKFAIAVERYIDASNGCPEDKGCAKIKIADSNGIQAVGIGKGDAVTTFTSKTIKSIRNDLITYSDGDTESLE